MSNIFPKPSISLLLLLLPCFVSVCLATTTRNLTTDQLALLALKSSITDLTSHHILAKNWTMVSSVCDWIGVTCEFRHLRVTALDLSYMNLSGTIPPHLGNLSFLGSLNMKGNHFNGELPEELSRFRRLKVLNLGNNSLSGQFPQWISSFEGLQHLDLWNNSFTGVIPQSISNMSKLTTLIAAHNSLQGNIPAEIFNMSSLERISLGQNSFSAGFLPDDMCRHFARLKYLGLGGAGLNGQIPSNIGQCSQLQQLYLYSNALTGKIPKEIGNLERLQVLSLWNNQLEGPIPKEIGNLSMLQVVYFDTNNLTGVIPLEMSKLFNVQFIHFGGNQLTGTIPVNIFNISSISGLLFPANNLSGHLPSTMCYTLPNLEVLFLSTNSIGGTIPKSISNCSKLEAFDVSDNDFTGKIPDSLGDLRFLVTFDLAANNLISDPSSPVLNFITSLANCNYLQAIDLTSNPLDGVLPDSVGNLSSKLEYVYADHCKIKGAIPSGIGNLSSLTTLDLFNNQLIGPLPNSIENLQKLEQIYLTWNKISVPLRLFCALQNLGALYLGGNLIAGGAIPDCLGNNTSLRYLHLYFTGLKSSLPMSLWNLQNLLELNLSSNSLTGSLPAEISNLKGAISMDFSNNYFSEDIPSSIGDLENLQSLSLAHNQLQGHIPEAVGKMLSLNRLDLSYNSLSGLIPISLENLQYLTLFNVSFNNLSGEIPSKGPFRNLTAESFISNQALCGAKRFHVSPCHIPKTQHGHRSGNMHKIVIISVVVIVVVAFTCLGLICLKYGRSSKTPNNENEGFSMISRKQISYFELLRATERYDPSNMLGSGSFGSVYKGTLDDGSTVAVKVFKLQLEGSFKTFDTECEVLRNLRHRNLIKVISCCSNPEFKALVLEYMPNGSLDSLLHSSSHFLNIMQRLTILIDVACALQYLHSGNVTPIVHCDLKPSNVLLDQEMVAHVSDFGISKLLGLDDSVTYTNTLATLCYVAPGEVSSSNFMFRKFKVWTD
ncbi:OLC1v1025459C3 [Oldenlandia corymbosa var. corymbosa]|uniref:non-specific serine/threonine protein kinase n=1 Tax=Oldenlandia corymbosa var. corymbosa TaxID=529605 RepID=A0AAV1C4X4_OLDCO|nr:OLC1v1025459C3 [Oldenlandia corymbosa var. corymbosa]